MINPDVIFGRLGNRLFQGAYLYAQMKRGEILDIFVQDLEYFEEYASEIKNLYGEGIGSIPYVGIHLRVGANPINPNEPKYSENPFYVNLSKTNYYQDAMRLFPNQKFLVFSDDIEFAKTYFLGDVVFDDSPTDLEAFNRFASCTGHIIANSSWSWWGAFLGKGKVVAPTYNKWFADGVIRTKVPSTWLQI